MLEGLNQDRDGIHNPLEDSTGARGCRGRGGRRRLETRGRGAGMGKDSLATEITNWLNYAQDAVREHSGGELGRDLVTDVLRACDEAISLVEPPGLFLAHRDAVETSTRRYASVVAEEQRQDAIALQGTAVSAALGNLREALITTGRASDKARKLGLASAGDHV